MYEFLWHGRGGQGAFTAARLLGAAYSLKKDGNYALAFPSFGPERRGAPIRAFTKLDTKKVGNRAEIEKADFAVYLDDTLFNDDAFLELKENGKIILCTKKIFTNYHHRRCVYCRENSALTHYQYCNFRRDCCCL